MTPQPPAPPESEVPLCRTRGCAELGIRAVDRWGFCGECKAARAEDAADAKAEAAREGPRFGRDW